MSVLLTNHMPRPIKGNVSKYNFGQLVNVTDMSNDIKGDVIVHVSTFDGMDNTELTRERSRIASAATQFQQRNPDRFLTTRIRVISELDEREVNGQIVKGVRVISFLAPKK